MTSSTGRIPLHFGLAACCLAAAAVGWNLLLSGKYLVKKPVPWPETVQVDEHRLLGFPESFGPYRLIADGEDARDPKTGRPKLDGRADGLLIPRKEVLETLGVARPYNWYYMAVYRDTRAPPPPGQPGRRFRLDATFYSGLLDNVPHIAERCIAAAGGTILPSSGVMPVEVPLATGVWSDWAHTQAWRTTYAIKENGQVVQRAQYHIFSMNAQPTASWEKVRWDLGELTLRYCYFSKIAVAPLQPEADSDAACREFYRYALPHVLKFLPNKADVEALRQLRQ